MTQQTEKPIADASVELTNANSPAEVKAPLFTMPVGSYALAFVKAAWNRMLNPNQTVKYVNLYAIFGAAGWTIAAEATTEVPAKQTEATTSVENATKAEDAPKEEKPKSNSKTGFAYFAGLTGQGFMRVISAVPVAVAFVAHEVVNAVAVVVGAAVALVGLPFDLVLGSGNSVVAGFKAVAAWWSGDEEDGANPSPNSVVNEKGDAASKAPTDEENLDEHSGLALGLTEEEKQKLADAQRIVDLAKQYQDLLNQDLSTDEFQERNKDDMTAIEALLRSQVVPKGQNLR